ncbi:hypothetical protein AB0J72_49895 [Dactylosporangium sp. NPDC049742]|uniref:tetratricopeptide repeat protein n=1 Tax=Dactylosporangium sp. NPDC049742 TaxID=3154737 RepID=UPI00343E3036
MDLDYRTRMRDGCIPPELVARLVELGHAGEVELQAGRGEWFCALHLARDLAGQDRQEEALAVLAPFVATGWWVAAETVAGLLDGWGRAEEAVALTRPYASGVGLSFVARLLARHGRGEEAFDLLVPHIAGWVAAEALVDVAEVVGRDEEAAVLLTARLETPGRSEWGRPRVEPDNAVELLAAIRERQGRVDEAVALLHTADVPPGVLADLLARHDRVEELRAYAATEVLGHATDRLAALLEERGDVEGAVGVYRQSLEGPGCDVRLSLAELLLRHGRGDEALEVLHALADGPGGTEDVVVYAVCGYHTDRGRPDEALAHLDRLKTRVGGEDWQCFGLRLRLMARCGLLDEAVDLARTDAPEREPWFAVMTVAAILADAGRTEEALAVLERDAPDLVRDRATLLIELGRVKEAVALLQAPVPQPTWPEPDGPVDEPPF